MNILETTRRKLAHIIDEMAWQDKQVEVVSARSLTPDEAIGQPERQDYPILIGKEVMVEASFLGYKGQAFTDQPGNYSGTLKEVLASPLNSNFERAVFTATINSLLRALQRVDKTVHCRDQEPGVCARQFAEDIQERFGNPRIAFIGLQPGMVAALAKKFALRVTDLNPDNLGKVIENAVVEDVAHTQEIIDWGDIVLATGSTVVNDSIGEIIGKKPVIFYGVTIAGIAHLNGLEQYCYCGH
jgi:Domain of unknown function (DUF364).